MVWTLELSGLSWNAQTAECLQYPVFKELFGTSAFEPAIVAVKSGFCPSLSRPFCGSAPAFNKASAVFQAAIVIAALNAERPAASSTVALALCARSEEMASWLRWSTASSNGARPLASVPWLGFAPSFSSFVKTSAGAEKFKASKTKDPSCFASKLDRFHRVSSASDKVKSCHTMSYRVIHINTYYLVCNTSNR